MNVGKSFYEIYKVLQTIEEDPKLVKHSIAGMVCWVFEELESSGQEVTPESIERVLKKEFSSYDDAPADKKVS